MSREDVLKKEELYIIAFMLSLRLWQCEDIHIFCERHHIYFWKNDID